MKQFQSRCDFRYANLPLSPIANFNNSMAHLHNDPAPESQAGGGHTQHHGHDHSHGFEWFGVSELTFAIACGVLLVTGWGLSFFTSVPGWLPIAFYLGAYFFGGFYATLDAISELMIPRFNIDFLMIVAAIGSAVLGGWGEGALLLFLFSMGHALEHYAMGRAKRAIEALAELTPQTAIVRRGDAAVEVAVGSLQIGDVVIVKPNERLPADGFVLLGTSSVNQAPITGESIPVDKLPAANPEKMAKNPEQIPPQHKVFAGSINESGALEIYVTHLAADSTLARVVKLVNEANSQKSLTQKFADRFEAIFVPIVLVGVLVLLFAFVVIDEPFSKSFYRSMAVLIGASPCALAISTPSAVLSGVARAARGGVLIKGGDPLENLGRVTAIAFDKTGTLTAGKPQMTDVLLAEGVEEAAFLRNVIAIERLSDHPLAAAVVRDGLKRLSSLNSSAEAKTAAEKLTAENLRSITGRGVMATIENETVYVGKESLFEEVEGPSLPNQLREQVHRLKETGRTTMIIRRGDQYLGAIGLMDAPRESARSVIADLKALGIERMVMLSGDNQQVANSVAAEVGIDEAHGDLMPADKVALIKQLQTTGDVAMIGDGVNDAPALASATVGIAMGAAGSAVALETADVALMGDDLQRLRFAIGLSRQTSRIIRQNLWISLGMVAILVPASLLGLRIGFAVVFHEGSTIAVVLNALRLLVYRDDRLAD